MDWKPHYRAELETPAGRRTVDAMLDAALDRDEGLASPRGIVSFPHTALACAGPLQARVAAAVYRAGVDRVLVLGVLHGGCAPIVRVAMDEARPLAERRAAIDRAAGGHLMPSDGIDTPFGRLPLAATDEDEAVPLRVDRDSLLADEFSLDTFCALMRRAADVLDVRPIPVLPVFVGLTRDPLEGSFAVAERLAVRIRALRDAASSMLVTTGDLVHYGTAYGAPDADASEPLEAIASRFRREIDRTYTAALRDREWALAHRLSSDLLHNDQREIVAVISALLGPAAHRLAQFEMSDYADILDAAPPCLVASALMIVEPDDGLPAVD